MGENQIASLLMVFLIIFGVILTILVIVYISLLMKSKKNKERKEKTKEEPEKKQKKGKTSKGAIVENVSVEDFMEFEKIEDNMIVQKDKYKYIMVIECQGVNYDLMSGVEKVAVEEGFVQFLNTLNHPIQIYIQTRTINLESSLNTYKTRVNKIQEELYKREQEYEILNSNNMATEQAKQKAFFSLTRQRNLYEYGIDIIKDTEQMSKNSNILNKKYFIVVPYYVSELGEEEFGQYEIKNIAFSELYTRSQAIIRTLTSCNVKGKILNSKELVELLYVAYNRDQEEIYNVDKALTAQYDKLYTTSEEVLKKKSRELDKVIENHAIEKATKSIDVARSEIEKEVRDKEKNMNELINEMAKIILEGNKNYIQEDIVDKAIENIDKETEKKVKEDEKEKNTRRSSSTRK